MKRRSMRGLGAGVALLLLGSACTFGAEDTGGDGGTAAPDEPVTLRVWTHQNKSFNQGLKDLAAEFQSDNPNVTLEFETFDYDSYIQTLQTALPAGTEADILQMFGSWTCSYADNLATVPADVSSVADAEAAFFEAPIGGYVCDDALYGFPQEFNIEYGATLVNADIAADAGVDLDGWASWDEFTADAKAMTEVQGDAITRAGYHFTAADGMSYSFFSLILQHGGQFLSDDGMTFTIDTPEAREAIAVMQSMVDEGVIDPELFNDTANWVGDCYFEEACAMGLVGPWVVPEYAADFPEVAEATEYVALPTVGDDPAFVADSGWGLTVSSNSPAANVAWDFVEFVTLDETNAAAWNVATGTLPALRANAEGVVQEELIADYPHFEAWFPILEHGKYVGNLPDRDLLWYEIAYPHLLGVLQGTETVDDALAAMESEANDTFRYGPTGVASATIEGQQRKRRWFGGREGAQRRFVAMVLSPAVAYMAVFLLLPIGWAFLLSFFDFSPRRTGSPFLGLGLDNPFAGAEHFRRMFDFSDTAPLEVRQFHLALKVTLLFAFVVVPLNLVITLPLAAMIESVRDRWKVAYRTIFFLPVLTSAVGVAIIWGFVLHPQRGLLNGLLTKVTGDVTVIAWTTDPDLAVLGVPIALLAIIVAYLWQDIGFNLVIFIAALQSIPDSVKDAAYVDGASAWQTFRYITLPLLKPTILLASVLTMISSFQVFDLFQVMTNGGPDDQTRALSLDIYESAFRYQRMGWAAAVSVVLFLLVFTISVVQSRFLRANWEY